MTLDQFAPILIALVALAGTGFTAIQSRRATMVTAASAAEVERIRVEADAYQRARATYEALLDRLQKQLDSMNEQLGRVQDQLASEKMTSSELRAKVATLQTQVSALERTVAELRRRLASLGGQSRHSG
jgi:septal ring factor EnvC (AmiA/AmiB activator)